MTGAPHRDAELAGSLAAVRARLAAAAEAAGRDVRDIDLLPITKFFPASDVIILRRLGCTDAQGYLFGKPVQAAEARLLVARGRTIFAPEAVEVDPPTVSAE